MGSIFSPTPAASSSSDAPPPAGMGALYGAASALLDAHPTFQLLITGHSLGGALAHLSAYELALAHPRYLGHI